MSQPNLRSAKAFLLLCGLASPCLAEDVRWNRSAGVEVEGSSLLKTAPQGWNAGGVSAQALGSGDGVLEFGTGEASAEKVCGLAPPNEGHGYSVIDFGLKLGADGSLTVLEPGAVIRYTTNGLDPTPLDPELPYVCRLCRRRLPPPGSDSGVPGRVRRDGATGTSGW